MEMKIDEMLEAGIIRCIHPWDVRFVAQTVLAQNAHGGDGLTINELKHRVNDQCTEHGIPSKFEMLPRPQPVEPKEKATLNKPKKWRMCQDFGEINRIMEITPVPQGEIWAKPVLFCPSQF